MVEARFTESLDVRLWRALINPEGSEKNQGPSLGSLDFNFRERKSVRQTPSRVWPRFCAPNAFTRGAWRNATRLHA